MAGDSIDNLARKLAEALPQGLKSMGDDLEANFRSVLKAGLGKLDLVTREEFDVQQAVLQRTRQKLDVLEERLASLEATESGPGVKTAAKAEKKAKPGK